MRRYIADCKGYTTGEYIAPSDAAAVEHALAWARETWTKGLLEVWDVRADQLVRCVEIGK